MKKIWMVGLSAVTLFAAMQTVRPKIQEKAPQAEIRVPDHIHRILEKHCYSCHSDEHRLEWYDEIQPAYWLVRNDILTAREHLNFSTLGSKPPAVQKATLFEAVNMIQLGAMPLPRFLALHRDAKVAPEELAELKEYLAPWPPSAVAPYTRDVLPAAEHAPNLHSVAPEWNGLAFDPDFESWKPLSYTDRGDNNTFRFVLGNDIAVKAAREGRISPWPDGTRFAKITWQQEVGSDGLIRPGKFVQVELMVKNARKYVATQGWAWGRWRGANLKPYGRSSKFVTECTSCHQPVKGNDFVYTLPMTVAKVAGMEVVNNRAASLPKELPYQPLSWTPITMYVDRKAHTMSTLFVNEQALRSVRSREASPQAGTYGLGSILAVITWVQREDPHWFGGRVPDVPVAAEFITINETNAPQYRRFDGPRFSEALLSLEAATQRVKEIMQLKPAPRP